MKINLFTLFMALLIFNSCDKDRGLITDRNNSQTGIIEDTTDLPKSKACLTVDPRDAFPETVVNFSAACSENAAGYIWKDNGNEIWTDAKGKKNNYNGKASFSTTLEYKPHKITLIVLDNDLNRADSVTETVYMTNQPEACFEIVNKPSGNNTYPLNQDITFNAGCSKRMDPKDLAWSWGEYFVIDENSKGMIMPTHKYKKAGTYTVTLYIMNGSGIRDKFIKTITIK